MEQGAVYMTSPIRYRRSRADMDGIRQAIYTVCAEDNPVTVRQVFYQLVSMGVVGKTENEYKGTVCRLLADMRRTGDIPYGWIADNTRWMRKPRTYTSLENALQATAEAYRRQVWADQDVYVEVWLEKDALAGVLYDVTAQWDVPLMVTRGYPSLSFLYEAADALRAQNKPAYLYYFGDYDPSGVDIPRMVYQGLQEFAPDTEINFHRVAVTPFDIEMYHLPTRPTKKSDSRAKSFGDRSVEVDALPPKVLRALATSYITQHVDQQKLVNLEMVEAEERKVLDWMAFQRWTKN